jgi:hypothetical protein
MEDVFGRTDKHIVYTNIFNVELAALLGDCS